MHTLQKIAVCIVTGTLLLSPILVSAQTLSGGFQSIRQQVAAVVSADDQLLTSFGSFLIRFLGNIHFLGGINFGSLAVTSRGSSGSSGATIPVLAPPVSWNGTDCSDEANTVPGYCGPAAVDTTQHGSGYALEPAASWTEPPHMWITSGCDGYCTGNNYTIGVVGGDANRAGIDHVTFYLEGSSVTVNAPTKDPRTGVYGWFVNVQLSTADGDAYMVADVVPTNGYVRRLLPLHVVLDTNATSSTFITRQIYYLNYPGCNDTNNGTSSGTSWCHLSYAMSHAQNGAVVIVKAGTTLYEDLAPTNVYPNSPGYNPCRMITVTSSSPGPSGTPYTITRTDIHENSEEWMQAACAILYDSAIIDNSKLPIVYAPLRNETVGFRNTTFTQPEGSGYTSGGPDLSSPNCQSEAAYPCLFGTSEFPGGLGKVLIDDLGGSNSFWIDSPGNSHMTQSGAFSLVRGVGYADVGEMVFTFGATPSIGTVPSFAILNSTFNQENSEPDRISSNWANNLLVSATTTSFTPIHYCDNKQTGGPFPGGVTEATTTVVELTQKPVTWTASFSGATMTVTSALSPSMPILQGMYFGDGTVTNSIKQMGYLNGSGQETFTLNSNWTGPSTDTVTSAGFNANGDDVPNGGYFLGGNEQYALFGVGSDLEGGAFMPLWIEGNNDTGSDWVGNSGTCNGVTLVRAGHPFILLTDDTALITGETPPGGYIYADDTSWAGNCPIAGVFCSNIVNINGGYLSGYSPGVSEFGILNANNQFELCSCRLCAATRRPCLAV